MLFRLQNICVTTRKDAILTGDAKGDAMLGVSTYYSNFEFNFNACISDLFHNFATS
jgi:hypothetical protein